MHELTDFLRNKYAQSLWSMWRCNQRLNAVSCWESVMESSRQLSHFETVSRQVFHISVSARSRYLNGSFSKKVSTPSLLKIFLSMQPLCSEGFYVPFSGSSISIVMVELEPESQILDDDHHTGSPNMQRLHPCFGGLPRCSVVILWTLKGVTASHNFQMATSKPEVVISQAADKMPGHPWVHEMTRNIKKESPSLSLVIIISLLSYVKVKILVHPVWRPSSWISNFRLHRKVFIVLLLDWRALKMWV
jgi:hypothetical protein